MTSIPMTSTTATSPHINTASTSTAFHPYAPARLPSSSLPSDHLSESVISPYPAVGGPGHITCFREVTRERHTTRTGPAAEGVDAHRFSSYNRREGGSSLRLFAISTTSLFSHVQHRLISPGPDLARPAELGSFISRGSLTDRSSVIARWPQRLCHCPSSRLIWFIYARAVQPCTAP